MIPYLTGAQDVSELRGVINQLVQAVNADVSAEAADPNIEFTRETALPLSALSIVYDVDGTSVALASSTDVATAKRILGIVTRAYAANATLTAVAKGEIVDPSMGLTPGPQFLSAAGGLTATPPATGALVYAGFAPDSGTLVIDFQPSITRV